MTECDHKWEESSWKNGEYIRCIKCTVLQSEAEINQAYEYVAYWKKQLRLDHIDFEVVMFPPEESNENLAVCKIAFGRYRQTIKIRHPKDKTAQDACVFRRDLEVVIVHELLHTKEMPWRDHPTVDEVFEKDKWLRGLHEDSLDAVAEALVRARRGITRD